MIRNFPIVVMSVIAAVVAITYGAMATLGMSSENVITAALSGLFGLATGTGMGLAIGRSERAIDEPKPEAKP